MDISNILWQYKVQRYEILGATAVALALLYVATKASSYGIL
jgi:hypothetical protein